MYGDPKKSHCPFRLLAKVVSIYDFIIYTVKYVVTVIVFISTLSTASRRESRGYEGQHQDAFYVALWSGFVLSTVFCILGIVASWKLFYATVKGRDWEMAKQGCKFWMIVTAIYFFLSLTGCALVGGGGGGSSGITLSSTLIILLVVLFVIHILEFWIVYTFRCELDLAGPTLGPPSPRPLKVVKNHNTSVPRSAHTVIVMREQQKGSAMSRLDLCKEHTKCKSASLSLSSKK